MSTVNGPSEKDLPTLAVVVSVVVGWYFVREGLPDWRPSWPVYLKLAFLVCLYLLTLWRDHGELLAARVLRVVRRRRVVWTSARAGGRRRKRASHLTDIAADTAAGDARASRSQLLISLAAGRSR